MAVDRTLVKPLVKATTGARAESILVAIQKSKNGKETLEEKEKEEAFLNGVDGTNTAQQQVKKKKRRQVAEGRSEERCKRKLSGIIGRNSQMHIWFFAPIY